MWPGYDCIVHLHAPVHATPVQAISGPIGDVNRDISSRESRQDGYFLRKQLQKLRQRKYFDSGEYYLQDSRQADAGAGEELPVAWKVLGLAMSCPAGNSPVSRHASTAHSSTDTQHARPACQHRAIMQHSSGSGEPAGLSPFARSSVPTGGQPLAFQHRPSRFRTTHTAEH